jgi:hypothetical protein
MSGNMNLISQLFGKYVDFDKEYADVITDMTRALLTDNSLLQRLTPIYGPVEERRPVERIEKTVAPRRDPGPHDTRVLEPDKSSGVANPDWPNDENLDTDPTEDRESRDIPRQPTKENILYRNT